MCGICGVMRFNENPGVSSTELEYMSSSLIHRGPDEYGFYVNSHVAIGSRRLSIIDIKNGRQPIKNEDESIVLVLNGEIYNYRELTKQLTKEHTFRSQSDAEILVHLYEEYGTDFLCKLNGMFAFVLWDDEQKVLICARDRCGQKPFYYAKNQSRLFFASEPKAILRLVPQYNEINKGALIKYLTYGYTFPPDTLYQGIKQLAAGHIMSVKCNGDSANKKYWEYNYHHHHTTNNIREIAAELRSTFFHAVERCLTADVAIGAFLSGGVDSSSIVTAANRIRPEAKIVAFSAQFEERSFDESNYARTVRNFANLDHHAMKITANDVLSALLVLKNVLDEPIADPSIITRYLISRFAREKVKVVLGGDGGDELFAGYPTYIGHLIAQRLGPAGTFIARKTLSAISRILPSYSNNYGIQYVLSQFAKGLGYIPEIRNQIWLGPFTYYDLQQLLIPDLLRGIVEEDLYSELHLDSYGLNGEDIIQKIQRYYFSFYLHSDLAKVDRAGMAASLEVRSPMLDNELIDFSLSLPSSYKVNKLSSKYCFKKSMSGIIPDVILKRKKRGFSVPIAQWLRTDLRYLAVDLLSYDTIVAQGLFNPKAVNSLLDEHMSMIKDNSRQLWALLMFSLWFENNIKN